MGVALKHQSGVEREGRHHEARRLVGVLVVAAEIVELIPGPLNLGLRHNEPTRASQRIACTLLKHYTCAVKTCGMRETSGVNGRRELEAVEVAVIGIQNHLRHTFVGNDRCAAVNLQRLILGNAQQRIPIGIGPSQTVILRQHRFGRLADVAGEVRNKVVIGYAVVVDVGTKLVTLIVGLDARTPTVFLGNAVARQIVKVDLCVKCVVLKSCFIAQHDAALGHDARRKRVVVVGRDIEVIRDRDIDAASRAHAVSWREKPRTTLVADGKCKPGRREDGNVLEVQYGSGA